MQSSNRELWLAFVAIVCITLVYLFVAAQFNGLPAASGFFGHLIGVLGFLLMLLTETLYSLRKRSRSARWGRMSRWLQFHIFTGLVGPYMVLLHSSWKFNGLAGLVMLLTVIIVFSGVVGRYIYTAIPRTADGVEVEAAVLERQIAEIERELQAWQQARPAVTRALAQSIEQSIRAGGILGRAFDDAAYRLSLWQARRKLDRQERAQAAGLASLLKRRRALQRQIASLALARRLLALWHTIHIPIGVALFATAFVHMAAAFYYATLLR
jgi:hypothetical protein